MNPSTYKGETTALMRDYQTKTGVILGQDRGGKGDCMAICGLCFHLLHSAGNEDDWYCSDIECGTTYAGIKVGSSIFRAHQFEIDSKSDINFLKWVSAWSGIDPELLDIQLS